MALLTISEVGGCVGLARGFLAFFSFFVGDCVGGVAVTGAASVSAILNEK